MTLYLQKRPVYNQAKQYNPQGDTARQVARIVAWAESLAWTSNVTATMDAEGDGFTLSVATGIDGTVTNHVNPGDWLLWRPGDQYIDPVPWTSIDQYYVVVASDGEEGFPPYASSPVWE